MTSYWRNMVSLGAFWPILTRYRAFEPFTPHYYHLWHQYHTPSHRKITSEHSSTILKFPKWVFHFINAAARLFHKSTRSEIEPNRNPEVGLTLECNPPNKNQNFKMFQLFEFLTDFEFFIFLKRKLSPLELRNTGLFFFMRESGGIMHQTTALVRRRNQGNPRIWNKLSVQKLLISLEYD